jgi:hypothetical protein
MHLLLLAQNPASQKLPAIPLPKLLAPIVSQADSLRTAIIALLVLGVANLVVSLIVASRQK